MQIFQHQDTSHLESKGEIQQMMQQPQAMQEWFQSKKDEFNALPED